MLFSYNWLKEYVEELPSVAELAQRLTMTGTEVETVTEPGAGISGVVTAEVASCEPHPNADRLQLCRVRTDKDEFSIVCGAKNMVPGDRVALALIGALLPGGFRIKRSKIRGVVSEGMMCSEVELGLADESAGIMILPKETPLGLDIREALGLNDAMMEVGITPNRADLLSVRGLAREIGAVTGSAVKVKHATVAEGSSPVQDHVSVSIEQGCPCRRYAARVIKGVKVGPSPESVRRRLEAHGIRSINNVVDATNYVLLELGQPLHAFDLDRLGGARIDVRCAAEGEKITTIDGKERALDTSMLVIADADGPVALAGVMGGKHSEVGETTTDVLLESAWFEPSSVRRTSRKAALSSDSSYRFERGVDINGVTGALDAAAAMIKELAGGDVARGMIDIYPEELKTSAVKLRMGRTSELLGVKVAVEQAEAIMVSLGMAVDEAGEGTLAITPPSYRFDIKEETDLVEEVARLFGYDSIPTTMPVARITAGEPGARTRIRRKVSGVLTGEGFYEAVNYSFVSRDIFGLTGAPDRPGVTILNPLTEEQVVMRDTLLPSLLDTLRRNIVRKNEDLRIFEFAPAFVPVPGEKLPAESWKLAGLMYGRRWGRGGRSWSYPKEQLDFFDVKGIVEKLFASVGAEGPLAVEAPGPSQAGVFHPGKSAVVSIGSSQAGVFGEVHPDFAARFELKRPAFAFELDVEALSAMLGRQRAYTPVPRFPESTRDMAFIIDENVPYMKIINSIELLNTKLVERVELFDVYYGGSIPEGMRSIALRIVYRSKDRTLTHQEVDDAHSSVAAELKKRFDVEIRGGDTRNM
ncbi:MAG: phenylalanine--tRNA ligase subunit beta [Thermodesulfobacteriota bacterium]